MCLDFFISAPIIAVQSHVLYMHCTVGEGAVCLNIGTTEAIFTISVYGSSCESVFDLIRVFFFLYLFCCIPYFLVNNTNKKENARGGGGLRKRHNKG